MIFIKQCLFVTIILVMVMMSKLLSDGYKLFVKKEKCCWEHGSLFISVNSMD